MVMPAHNGEFLNEIQQKQQQNPAQIERLGMNSFAPPLSNPPVSSFFKTQFSKIGVQYFPKLTKNQNAGSFAGNNGSSSLLP